MDYQFDLQVAIKVGLDQSIFIRRFFDMVLTNRSNQECIVEGRTYVRSSYKAYSKIFRFWTDTKVRRVIEKLIDDEVLVKGNFNEKANDHTLWLAFNEEAKWMKYFTPKEIHGKIDESNKPKRKSNRQAIPESEEDVVKYYMEERNLSEAEAKLRATKFFLHYKAKGWTVGKNKMKDWKAAARLAQEWKIQLPPQQQGGGITVRKFKED